MGSVERGLGALREGVKRGGGSVGDGVMGRGALGTASGFAEWWSRSHAACEATTGGGSVRRTLVCPRNLAPAFRRSSSMQHPVCPLWKTPCAPQAANAFCAVRPPGHHAGPLGVVSNANDPNGRCAPCLCCCLACKALDSRRRGWAAAACEASGYGARTRDPLPLVLPSSAGPHAQLSWPTRLAQLATRISSLALSSTHPPPCSHGFCLFNNAAIGAAYAMNVYRHAGVQRVAIVDFDVHHGNGTGAFHWHVKGFSVFPLFHYPVPVHWPASP